MLYIVTYNINTTIKDYSSLYEKIKELSSSYQHPMESVWFVSCKLDANSLCQKLKAHLSSKDHIFVAEIPENITNLQGWLPKNFWDWLKKELHK